MKQKIIPVAAIVVGLLAFILSNMFIGGKIQEKAEEYEKLKAGLTTTKAICASKDLTSGSTITFADLAEVDIVARFAQDDFIASQDMRLLIGRKVLIPVKQNRLICWQNIEGGGPSDRGLAPLIKKSLRAISLPISGAAGVSGMVQPNDRVDILGTFSFPSKDNKGDDIVTMTLLQDVTILACGQTLAKQNMAKGQQKNTGYGTVTIEVTPSEAEVLTFAQQIQGRLTLTLRNPEDLTYTNKLPTVNFEHIQSRLNEMNMNRQTNIRQK